jgi:hypothetical protein
MKRCCEIREVRASQLTLQTHPVVTVKGKAFFDTHHARKNPLKNTTGRSGGVPMTIQD